MSSATFDLEDASDGESGIQYRAVPPTAIIGLLLGLLSFVTLVAAAYSWEACLLGIPIPIAGLLLSMYSLTTIRRAPDLYTGGRFARAGVALSALFLVTGLAYARYVLVTEMPADHTRITFPLRPNEVQERGGVTVPPEIQALDGKRVFIKGYMRPPEVKSGIGRFLLVRDNNQCCFGDISALKYYDQIFVDLGDLRRLNYSDGLFAIGGVLKVMPQNVGLGPEAPVFALVADYAK